MKNAVWKVREALAKKDIVESLTHYLVKDGRIFAGDGRVLMSAVFPSEKEFLVPGSQFEKILSATPGLDLKVNKDHIILKSKKVTAKINTLDPRDFKYTPEVKGKWEKCPDGFLSSIRKILPFVSDNAAHSYALCIAAKGQRLFATNNLSLAWSEVKGLKGKGELIPRWAINCLLNRREKLTRWMRSDTFVAFEWEDKSWMRAAVPATEFPDKAFTYADEMKSAKWEIPLEWKEALDVVSTVAEDDVKFYGARMEAQQSKAKVEYKIETPLPKGHEVTAWSPNFLGPVVELATHIDFSAYPNPVPFRGHMVEGFIMGRAV